MYFPSPEQFAALATQGNLIPIYREILADMETPVSAFKKIDDGKTSFLLESIEGGEKWARYSFLGSGPGRVFRSRGKRYEVLEDGRVIEEGECADPLAELKAFLAPLQAGAHRRIAPLFRRRRRLPRLRHGTFLRGAARRQSRPHKCFR